MDRSSTIVPLSDGNYATWKIQMKMYLVRDGLFKIVDGSETAPVARGTVQPSEADISKFINRQDKALANIVLNIDPKLLYLIPDPIDPALVWRQLQDTFQKKTWANKLRLKRKLYNMRLQEDDDLQLHLKNFIELFDALSVIGENIEDEDRVINLLASLPESYSTIVTALEALENVPTWQVVTERLLHHEEKHKVGGETQALYLEKSRRPLVKCYECGNLGHIRKNCFKLMKNKKKYSSSSYKHKAQAAKYESDDEVVLLSASTVSALHADVGHGSFIIDSGCTQNMAYDRKLFCSFENVVNGTNVQVGDGSLLKIEGRGDVLMKLDLPSNKKSIM